jgi:hypothetical protein
MVLLFSQFYCSFGFAELVRLKPSSLLLLLQKNLFISFACPKETNQRKGQPQIFFGIAILSAAHAIQLVPLKRDSNSIAYNKPTQQASKQSLFPKII